MGAAERQRLKKEIEKEHAAAKSYSHDDLRGGTWFMRYVERRLAGYSNPPTPPEIKEKFKPHETPEALSTAVIQASVREVIDATDAYEEHLTSHEVKSMKEKAAPGKPTDNMLMGDSVALVAELLYTVYLDIHLCFQLAAANGRMLNAAQGELLEEVFGRAFGGLDVEKLKAEGELAVELGKRIYDRAILQCLGTKLADAQRKGFYVLFVKAIGEEFRKVLGSLPVWEAPKPLTGAMSSAPVEDDTSFGT